MTEELPTTREATEIAGLWLKNFDHALESGETKCAAELFRPVGYFRDVLALTWDLRTFKGRDAIVDALDSFLQEEGSISSLHVDGEPSVFTRRDLGPTIEAFFNFETNIGLGRGHLRLLQSKNELQTWEALTLFTTMVDLKGFEEASGSMRPKSTVSLSPSNHIAQSSGDALETSGPAPGRAEPQVVVIGAGQAGLAVAARLKALSITVLVIEKDARIGDHWRARYQSLVLHNQVHANHMPFLKFPTSHPEYLSKDQFADWLESYALALSIDVKTSTMVASADFDSDASLWTLTLEGDDGSKRVLHPQHVVVATGAFGSPKDLSFPGEEKFQGSIFNAVDYRGVDNPRDFRVLVIGAGASGHDVAQDLCERGADVTMLQRTSTCVVSVEPGALLAYSIYSEEGLPIEDADIVNMSVPRELLATFHVNLTKRIANLDRDLLEGLERAGFITDFGDDGSGFLMKYLRTGGGYYINVGCSDLIAAGKIKVKQGVKVEHLEADSVIFSDGSSLQVDMVVIAIGYLTMASRIESLFGPDVTGRVGPVWGLDEEGETQGLWRRTNQPGLWLMGGGLNEVRAYSKTVALQIKAELEGLAVSLPVRGQAIERLSK